MKPSSTLKTVLAALCALGLVTAGKADYTTDLLSQWTFNSGTAADLTSDVGGYTFDVAGNPVDPYTLNTGSIIVWGGSELVATNINSTAQPALGTTATVWVRMQNNYVPGFSPQFFFGLENATAPADWDQMAMTGEYNNGSIGQYANTSLGPPNGNYGTTFVTAPALDTYFTMALVLTSGFDEVGNPDPTRTRFQTYMNGVQIGQGSALGTTVPSLSFALGTLKASGGGNYTFDEARVYDAALTGPQISQIEAAPIPEPSVLALLGGGIFLVTVQAWRRNRRGQHKA